MARSEAQPLPDWLRKLTPQFYVPILLVVGASLFIIGIFHFFDIGFYSTAFILFPMFGIALLVFYHRVLPWLLVIVMLPLVIPGAFAPKFKVYEAAVPVLFVVLILQMTIRRTDSNRFSFRSIPLPVRLFLAIGVASFLVYGSGPQNIFGFRDIGNFRGYFTLFCAVMTYILVLALLRRPEQIRTYQRILVWVSFLSIIYLLGLLVLRRPGTPLLPEGEWRPSIQGGVIRCIQMGSMGLLLVQTVLVFKYPKPLWGRALMMATGIVSILFSGGRAALIGLVLTFVLYAFLMRHFLMLLAGLLLGVLALAVPLVFPSVVDQMPGVMQRGFTFVTTRGRAGASSILWRSQIWQFTMEKIKEQPVFGTGVEPVDIDELIMGAISRTEYTYESYLLQGAVHNVYLAVAKVYGIPALLVFLSIYLLHFRRALQLHRHAAATAVRRMGTFAIIAFAFFFIRGFIGRSASDPYDWFILGLVQATWLMAPWLKPAPQALTPAPAPRNVARRALR